MSVHVEIDFLI